MSVLPIFTYGSSVLRKKGRPVVEVSDELVKLVMDMFDTMRNANGIGLAATQVGSLCRVVVIDLTDLEGTKEVRPITLINPEVISTEGKWTMEEGCLSIPDVRADVERPETVRIRFKNAHFADVELEATGIVGRVILHEIDHLDGVLFIDHLATAQKKLHLKDLKKIQRGEIEVDYPVITAARVSV